MGAAALLLAGGLLAMLAGGGALIVRSYASQTWAATEEATDAARQLSAPSPRWIDEAEPAPTPRPAPTTRAATPTSVSEARTEPPPTPQSLAPPLAGSRAAPASDSDTDGDPDPDVAAAEPPAEEDLAASPEPRAPASAVVILESEFRFLDPPEPGAQARITLQVQNRSDLPTGPLRLTLSRRWLQGWRLVDAEPPVLANRIQDDARRAFDFPGLDGESEGAFELHLVATDDAVDPPDLRLALADADAQGDGPGNEIGRVQPETVAPRPRPGPARALQIPRLGLRAAVVQTTWEPPGFVVGQLRETANLGEGNTVLIGHLTGLAGNVFARLEELEPGDEIVATSRGLEYRFVVSETMVLPGDDSIPIQPTDTSRLTLMTCTGDWDPIGLDYSHRLWVVAEPPERAESTLVGGETGPLTRQLGLAPALTIQAPADLGPSPKEMASVPPELAEPAALPAPGALILAPSDGAHVGQGVVVRGRRTEAADPSESLWLVVRAEIEGSRWYLYGEPLKLGDDGVWEASLEIGGSPGIRHTIAVAPVDRATDARLRRQAAQRPGEPLSILPDAFEAAARIVVERR